MRLRRKSVDLPYGDYFMITMNIADSFGGLTSAMLERSRVFADVAGVPTTIITVDPQPTYGHVQQRLIDERRISSNVKIVNFHEELRSRPGPPTAPLLDAISGPDVTLEVDENGAPFCQTQLDPGSRLPHRLIYTRPDGRVYLEEQRKHDEAGNRTDRTFVRYFPDGPTQYANAGKLYRAWFDEIKGDRFTVLIVDSKFAAIHFRSYERPDVYKFHVLHGYHAIDAGHPITGRLTSQRRPVLMAQECWDGIITLTDSNRRDLEMRFGPSNNRFVVSNIVQRSPKYPPFRRRSRTRGVMIARLAPVKNIPRAMRIIKLAHAQDPRIGLDIYGGGPDEDKLRKLRSSMGLDDVVFFHGPTPHASRHFDRAAFTLITSNSEMQPLVLMEAMGRGCPPIALDIRYGPADILRHGITGFLIPNLSEKWAAHSVIRVVNRGMRARLVSHMTWHSSRNFSAGAALAQWSRAIAAARRQRSERVLFSALQAGQALATGHGTASSLRIPLEVGLTQGSMANLHFDLVWITRETGCTHLLPGVYDDGDVTVSEPFPTSKFLDEHTEPTDAYLQVSGANVAHRLRISISSDAPEWTIDGRSSYRTVNGNLSIKVS